MAVARRLDPGLLRMMDANLNRASEGLRAAEDVLRFVRRDARLSREARGARHAIRLAVLAAIPASRLVAARDSERDPGRSRWRAGRRSVSDLLFANLRRAQESARVLEEALRLAGRPAAVRAMQAARYRLYSLESASARSRRPRDS